VSVVADRVHGCSNCGKPAYLVGDRVLMFGLCPWCHAEAVPGAVGLRDREQLASVADKLREHTCADTEASIDEMLQGVENDWNEIHRQLVETERERNDLRAKLAAAEARLAAWEPIVGAADLLIDAWSPLRRAINVNVAEIIRSLEEAVRNCPREFLGDR
jgi:septal ring factor EnvC (AmiA/AmiB activator)